MAEFTPFWVQNHQVTNLWSGPDDQAVNHGRVPQWSYLQVVQPQTSPRLFVYVPWTNNYAYVDSAAVGPSGPPPAGWSPDFGPPAVVVSATPARPASVPGLLQPAPHLWQGTVRAGTLVVRSAPNRRGGIVAEIPSGTPIAVDRWVEGETVSAGNYTWAHLGSNLFGYSAALQISRPAGPPPLPANAPTSGRWLDVNLTRQLIAAYEGRTPVRVMVTSSGKPGWETPTDTLRVVRRVFSETMDSGTLLGNDAASQRRPATYLLENVLHTQYFTWYGHALHYNYWIEDWGFGTPRSHGCLGLRLADSSFLWDFARVGTPLVIHY
jgi:lipoprotein-anchoring transpeptidase ErfK/SrfK